MELTVTEMTAQELFYEDIMCYKQNGSITEEQLIELEESNREYEEEYYTEH
jgi:hypothetical protein